MDFKRIAIIGADCISVSIALGLKAQKEPPEIIGYDAEAVIADSARARGAFDRLERKPDRACQNADLVIVAVPLPSIRETFVAIAPHLQPGCFVTDTARLKAPVMRWAEELLPESVFFVGGHIIPNPAIVGFDSLEGLEAANANLLSGALYCLTTPTRTSSVVMNAFTELAEALGADPFFIDVAEHDGLQAGVEGLPDLLAIALLRATVDTPGWQEMRKFAGHRFAVATEATDDVYRRQIAIFLNRENVLRRLNLLLDELVRLRDLLTHDDAEPFEKAFVAAAGGRARWIEEREQGMWVKERGLDTDQIPTAGEQIRHLIFGGHLSTRRKEEPGRSRKG
jgi:prephenate dehydrogenase